MAVPLSSIKPPIPPADEATQKILGARCWCLHIYENGYAGCLLFHKDVWPEHFVFQHRDKTWKLRFFDAQYRQEDDLYFDTEEEVVACYIARKLEYGF